MSHQVKSIPYTILDVQALKGIAKTLYFEAKKASDTAHAPYSSFSVGAALLLENNQIVRGSNQENAAYPSGICAERVALFYAGAEFPQHSVMSLMVYVSGKNMPPSPCGGCLQVMAESEDRHKQPIRVYMANDSQVIAVNSVDALLPFRFGRQDLQPDNS